MDNEKSTSGIGNPEHSSANSGGNRTESVAEFQIPLQTPRPRSPASSVSVVVWWTECEQDCAQSPDVTCGCTKSHHQLSVTDTTFAEISQQADHADQISDVVAHDSDTVVFQVGTGPQRREMICKKSQMAAISPVFSAMFRGSWKETQGVVEIVDVEPQAMKYLIRYASDDLVGVQQDEESTTAAWDVLKAADKYQVLPVVRRCLHVLANNVSSWREAQTIFQVAYQVDMEGCHKVYPELVTRFSRSLLSDHFTLATLCFSCKVKVFRVGSGIARSWTEARKLIYKARHVDADWCHKVCPQLVYRFRGKVLDDRFIFAKLCSGCKIQVVKDMVENVRLWAEARKVIFKASELDRGACHNLYSKFRQRFTVSMAKDSSVCSMLCYACMLQLLTKAQRTELDAHQLRQAAHWWARAACKKENGRRETGTTALFQRLIREAGIFQVMPWRCERCFHVFCFCACSVFAVLAFIFLFVFFIFFISSLN